MNHLTQLLLAISCVLLAVAVLTLNWLLAKLSGRVLRLERRSDAQLIADLLTRKQRLDARIAAGRNERSMR